MKDLFDGECCRVVGVGLAGGTFAGMSTHELVGVAVGIVTFLYVLVKLCKQLRDWSRPDRD